MTQPGGKTQIKRKFINPIFKDIAIVLKTSRETGGVYTLGQLELSPGGRNFPHYHTHIAETFKVVEGVLGLMYNRRKIYLRPGQSITIPVYTPHFFFNDTNETVICQVKLEPGTDDFIKGIAIGYGLASDGKTNKSGKPKKIAHLAIIMILMDTRPVGATNLIYPFLRWLAARARKNGTEKILLDQYYYA